jgi:tryptophan-rich sensory protein
VKYTDSTSDWYKSLHKPALYPQPYVFSIMWTVIYISIFIGVVIAGVNTPIRKCVAIVYTLLMIILFIWVSAFAQQMLFFSGIDLLLALFVAIWMVFLVRPMRTGKGKFPMFAFGLLAFWLIIANYLGWSIWYLNEGQEVTNTTKVTDTIRYWINSATNN